jgi:antitoxin CptB
MNNIHFMAICYCFQYLVYDESSLTLGQAQALETLMDLADNDLLDLLLRRKEPEAELATAPVVELLQLMRTPQTPASFSQS